MKSRRERGLAHVRARMLRHGHPRMQMLAVLVITGGAGFAASFTLLHLGVRAMAVRYPVAVVAAYATFLLALRLWLGSMMRRRERSRSSRSSADTWDLGDLVPGRTGSGGSGSGGGVRFGGGGGFAGGGSGGDWAPAPAPMPVAMPLSAPPGPGPALQGLGSSGARAASSGSHGGGFSFGLGDLDLDDDSGALIALALLVLAAAALVAAAGYILVIAPVLLAELVVDGIVVSGLYRRVRTIDDAEWLKTAVLRTWIPALLMALLLGGVGFGVQALVPRARSIGDVWRTHPAHARDVGAP